RTGLLGATDYGAPSLDNSVHLLVPTLRGLYRKNKTRSELVGREKGTSGNGVVTAFQDHEGAVWIALNGHGVDRWPNPESWSGWSEQEGLPSTDVSAILRDQKRRLWVASSTGIGMWDAPRHHWRIWRDTDGAARG